MKFQQIRSATAIVTFGNVRFLIDPWLGDKGSIPPLPGSPNGDLSCPIHDLPCCIDQLLQVDAVIATHLHFDHIFGNNFAEETFGVAAKAHNADMPWLLQIGRRLASFGIQYNKSVNPIKPENFLQEGDVIRFGRHTFQILHIPGHSPGSLVYYCKEENTLFCGDVLFKGSLGRYDFADSNGTALVQGIRQKLFTLPDNTIVYSGHGPSTTIGTEKVYNIIHSL